MRNMRVWLYYSDDYKYMAKVLAEYAEKFGLKPVLIRKKVGNCLTVWVESFWGEGCGFFEGVSVIEKTAKKSLSLRSTSKP